MNSQRQTRSYSSITLCTLQLNTMPQVCRKDSLAPYYALLMNRFILVDMAPSPLKQDRYAWIDNSVEHFESLLPSGHNASICERSKLIRSCLTAHLRFIRKRPNAEFASANK